MTTYTTVEEVLGAMGVGPGTTNSLNADSGVSQANPDRVYIDANYQAQVEIGQTIMVVERDVSGDIITRYERGVVIGRGAGYLVLAVAMTQDFLLVNNPAFYPLVSFGPTSNPSYNDFKGILEELEDYIDHRTHHCWRQRVETEWKEFFSNVRGGSYPYSLGSVSWKEYSTGWRVTLMHRSLKAMDDTVDTAYLGYPGDSLLVWRGGAYEEWVNAGDPLYVAKVEDRANGDFWIDYDNGYLYFVGDRPQRSDRALKIRYRYGEDAYPTDSVTGEDVHGPGFKDIKRACRLLAQAEFLRNERFSINFPGGDEEGAINPLTASRDMVMTAEKILDLHTEVFGWYGGQ